MLLLIIINLFSLFKLHTQKEDVFTPLYHTFSIKWPKTIKIAGANERRLRIEEKCRLCDNVIIRIIIKLGLWHYYSIVGLLMDILFCWFCGPSSASLSILFQQGLNDTFSIC